MGIYLIPEAAAAPVGIVLRGLMGVVAASAVGLVGLIAKGYGLLT